MDIRENMETNDEKSAARKTGKKDFMKALKKQISKSLKEVRLVLTEWQKKLIQYLKQGNPVKHMAF
jgi:hypothetical protein